MSLRLPPLVAALLLLLLIAPAVGAVSPQRLTWEDLPQFTLDVLCGRFSALTAGVDTLGAPWGGCTPEFWGEVTRLEPTEPPDVPKNPQSAR